MPEVDALIRMRNRFLALAGLSFLLWQAMQVGQSVAPHSAFYGIFLLLGLVGIAGFLAAMVIFLVYASRVTRSRTQDVLEDELFAHTQARAIRMAYIALMGAVVAVYVVTEFVVLPIEHVARGLMVVGVCVPLFAFLVLDRLSGGEASE